MHLPPTFLVASLFVGSLFGQATWTQLAPANAPSARTEVVMPTDYLGALMFGGVNGTTSTAFNELWRFDGTNWTLLTPTGASPSPRSRLGGDYDLLRGRFVIFGGDAQYVGGGSLGDTWEWDAASSQWLNPTPALSPSARIHARLVFDLLGARTILFGGRSGALPNAETWSWDGATWTLLTPLTMSPPAREQANVAYDSSTGEIVLFGGSSGAASGVLGDTWIWDGSDWRQVVTATTPGIGGIRNGKMTYDALRDRIVLFGGVTSTGVFSSSVWEFDGVDWTERLLTPRPSGRAGPGWCFVPALNTSYLWGGYSGPFYADTWSYQTNAVADWSNTGSGCPTSAGVPTLTLDALPWVGDTVQFQIGSTPPAAAPFLLLGFSTTAWAGGPLPFNLGPFGYAACQLLVAPDSVLLALAPLSLPIPTATGLIGLGVHGQAAAFEAVGPGIALGMSNRLDLTIGAR